jgi:hypothetical protein
MWKGHGREQDSWLMETNQNNRTLGGASDMKIVNECTDICSFCVLVQDLIKNDKMTHRDWQTFYMHLKVAHLWVEEIKA